jgi:hypothetical protein
MADRIEGEISQDEKGQMGKNKIKAAQPEYVIVKLLLREVGY